MTPECHTKRARTRRLARVVYETSMDRSYDGALGVIAQALA